MCVVDTFIGRVLAVLGEKVPDIVQQCREDHGWRLVRGFGQRSCLQCVRELGNILESVTRGAFGQVERFKLGSQGFMLHPHCLSTVHVVSSALPLAEGAKLTENVEMSVRFA